MDSVKVEIKPGGTASRSEVIIRILYGILLLIVKGVLEIIIAILWIINLFTCFILGQRVAADFIAKYVGWTAMIGAYILFVTDERLPLLPF